MDSAEREILRRGLSLVSWVEIERERERAEEAAAALDEPEQ